MGAFFLGTYRLIIWWEASILFYIATQTPAIAANCFYNILYLIYDRQHHIDVYVWSFP